MRNFYEIEYEDKESIWDDKSPITIKHAIIDIDKIEELSLEDRAIVGSSIYYKLTEESFKRLVDNIKLYNGPIIKLYGNE